MAQRYSKPLISASVFCFLLVLFFQNCSPVNFNNSPSSRPPPGGGDPTPTTLAAGPGGLSNVKVTLIPKQNSVPADIILISDNSASMKDSATQVRNNVLNFINSTESLVDSKLALVTQVTNTKDTYIALPISGPNYMQVDTFVGSNTSLSILLANLAAGQTLRNFLRPNVKKVFIVVTDDGSNVTAAQFKANLQTLIPGIQFTLFGWIGLGNTVSPCQAGTGTEYQTLANETGGKFLMSVELTGPQILKNSPIQFPSPA